MQITNFDPLFDRTFYAAFELNYSSGIKHPDRAFFQHDFIYIVEGEWEIFQENQRYLAKKDDVIILTADSRHYGKKPCSDNTKTMYIHTNASPCEQLTNSASDNSRLVPLEALIHCADNKNRIKRDFERLIDNFFLERAYKSHRLQSAFSTLLVDLFDAQSAQKDYSDNEMVMKLCRLFTDNPDKFYSNKELADHLFLGEKTFVERFKALTNETPHQYQIIYKLQNIKTIMLAHPEIKLRELALNNGFCDEFHFSKTFKKHFGFSPQRFKKQQNIFIP